MVFKPHPVPVAAADATDDDAMEELWKSQFSLQDFVDPKNFKSYDDLKVKLDKVLGIDGGAPKPTTTVEDVDDAPEIPTKEAPAASGDDDDGLSFFQKLADEES